MVALWAFVVWPWGLVLGQLWFEHSSWSFGYDCVDLGSGGCRLCYVGLGGGIAGCGGWYGCCSGDTFSEVGMLGIWSL